MSVGVTLNGNSQTDLTKVTLKPHHIIKLTNVHTDVDTLSFIVCSWFNVIKKIKLFQANLSDFFFFFVTNKKIFTMIHIGYYTKI